MNGIGWIERLAQDLRYAVRQVRRSPGFAGVVVATLGLGIGGATAVFSVVQAVLLAPLPYRGARTTGPPLPAGAGQARHARRARGHALHLPPRSCRSFEDVAALAHYSETGLDLVTDGRRRAAARPARVERLLQHAALAASRSAAASTATTRRGTAQRVVLSDAVWRTHFAGDPSIVGTTIRLSAEAYEVAGVAPPGFDDPIAPDVAAWMPYALAGDTYRREQLADRRSAGCATASRLERAQAELATLTPPMRERWPAAKTERDCRDAAARRARGAARGARCTWCSPPSGSCSSSPA